MKVIKYPHRTYKKVINGAVIILEKIDGSNLGLGYIDDTLIIQSRNVILGRSNTVKIDFFDLHYILDTLIDKITKIKTNKL